MTRQIQSRRVSIERLGLVLLIFFLLLTLGVWMMASLFFVADDSYFYLVTARNFALTGDQSFSGVYPTNGVHPLWMLLLEGYSRAASWISPDLLDRLSYAVPLSWGLIVAGTYFFFLAAKRLDLNPLLVAGVPVCYLSLMGVLYSEAHAYFACLGLLVWLAAKEDWKTRGGPVRLGLAAGLVALARLDSVFFLAAFYLWYLYLDRRLGRVVLSGLVCTLVLAPYLAVNYFHFGGLTPISGWIKSTFPALGYFSFFGYYGHLNLTIYNSNLFFGVMPVLFATAVGVVLWKRLAGPATIIYPMTAGTWGHLIYTSFFTSGCYWYWYYVLNMSVAAVAAALLVRGRPRLRPWVSTAAVAMLVLACLILTLYRTRYLDLEPHNQLTLAYTSEHQLDHQTILVSEWPGTVAYQSHNRIIAADLLTANRALRRDMIASGNALQYLVDFARRRGYPIKYIYYNGGDWMVPSPDLGTLIYYDPKDIAKQVKIGELAVGTPIYRHEAPPFYVWKLP